MPRGIPNKKQDVDSEEIVENALPEGVKSEEVKEEEYTATIIKDYYGNVDITYLNKSDVNFKYRFLRFDPKRLSIATGNMLFNGGGWQLCSKEHLLRIGIPDREIGVDGLLHRGDLVLAFIPKRLYEEKMKVKQEKAMTPIQGIRRLLKEGDSSVGGAGMHRSMKGIQTGKQLGME